MLHSTEAWLHALWGARAQVIVLAPAQGPNGDAASQRPILTEPVSPAKAGIQGIRDRTLHLPQRAVGAPALALAAAAHAAAHWQFGGPPQPRAGLKPVQLALFGVLEDARVEWLALQELPGLRSLWLPFHAGDDAPGGMQFDSLLDRLSRSLLDPAHDDPHPWVVRARAMVFDSDGVLLALRTPADVRVAASRLGNDIGQMRLPFNAATWRQHAAYRDDNTHLWQADETLPASDQPLAGGASGDDVGGRPSDHQPLGGTPVLYPEWDHCIGRYRPDWAHVYASDGPSTAAPHPHRSERHPAWRHRLARALAGVRTGPPRAEGRASWGDQFHPAALVEARLDQRLRRTPDDRVYRRLLPARAVLRVVLLVDASSSTSQAGADGTRLLDRMLMVVRACATALERSGHHCAALAFCSRGRHRVELLKLKDWAERADAPQVRARWQGLEPGGSTRSGAALRHATAWLGAAGDSVAGLRRQVLLVTDGEPHDVDVHDPRYLVQDLQRAIAEAGRRGVHVRSLTPQVLARRQALGTTLARLLAS